MYLLEWRRKLYLLSLRWFAHFEAREIEAFVWSEEQLIKERKLSASSHANSLRLYICSEVLNAAALSLATEMKFLSLCCKGVEVAHETSE